MDRKEIERTTLTNDKLIERCSELISDFCKNGKKSKLWYMSIPARPNEDCDLVFSELINRFTNQQQIIKELQQEKNSLKCCGNCTHHYDKRIEGKFIKGCNRFRADICGSWKKMNFTYRLDHSEEIKRK